VLGREAMAAVEKATTSTARGTVSAVMKDRLADAMAAGDTQAVTAALPPPRRPHCPAKTKKNRHFPTGRPRQSSRKFSVQGGA
jgi:hypothetical protein